MNHLTTGDVILITIAVLFTLWAVLSDDGDKPLF